MHDSATASFFSRNRESFVLLLTMSLLYFFSYFHRMGIPGTIFDMLQSDFQLSASGVSLFGAIYLYVYGAMQIPTGMLVDRFGGVRIIAVGGLFLIAGSFLFPMAQGVGLAYATRALLGIGSSFMWISILKVISERFDSRHFAVIAGMVVFIGYSGGLLGTLPFERAADAWGWRKTLMGVAVASTLFFALFAVLSMRARRAVRLRPSAASTRASLKTVLRNASIYPIILGFPVQFSIYFVVQGSIGKKMLQDTMGVTSTVAAAVTFSMMVISIVCASTAGVVSRMAGNRRKPIIIVASGFALVGTAGMLLGLLLSAPAAVMAASYVVLSLSTIGTTINISAVKELNARESAGTAVGVLNAFSYLLIALMSNGAGWVLDAFQAGVRRTGAAIIYPREAYVTLIVIFLAMSLISFAVIFRVRETHGMHTGQPADAGGESMA